MKTIYRHMLCCIACVAISFAQLSAQQSMDEMWGNTRPMAGKSAQDERGQLFKCGKYAMFIHWGLYSHLGNVWNGKTYYGIGEWMMNEGMASADPVEYMATAQSFNPVDFDAMKVNVGPDSKGNIKEEIQSSLRTAGKWIARHPCVVYGAEPSPWRHAMPWGDIVQQGRRLYLCLYQWPMTGKLYLPGLHSGIKKANVLSNGKRKRVKWTQQADGWTVVDLPCRKPDPLVPVIEMEMATDSVQVDPMQSIDPEIGLPSLSVLFAQTEGCSVYKSSWMEKFGEWKHRHCTNDLGNGGRLTWTVNVKQAGTYNVQVEARGEGRSVWRLDTDEGQVLQNQQGVSSLFMHRPLGWIQFDKPGVHTFTLTMPEGGKCDVASLEIVPVYMEN